MRTYSSAQLLAFYLLFVWLVPLVFFVAGSVTSQSLPVVGERMRDDEDDKAAKGGRWSIAGIGRWCKREKASGGRESKDDESTAAQSHNSGRYEPNPAYYGNTGTASATQYAAYQPPHQQPDSNGSGAVSWYGQQPNSYSSTGSEGEWMGQRNAAVPSMAVRQRSHVS